LEKTQRILFYSLGERERERWGLEAISRERNRGFRQRKTEVRSSELLKEFFLVKRVRHF